jgi:uncharacterized protein
VTERLGAAELRRAIVLALESLRSHRAQIDDANVYPVPDGDTGTNLVLTMEAVAAALHGVPDRAPDVARVITQASLAAAKGNSGAILAQFLRGLCEAVGADGADAAATASGFKRAAGLAYRAMYAPREGTALTVGRAAADAAQEGGDLAAVVEAAARGGREALAHTPDLLPILRAEGVLDAGGIGLCIVLDSLAEAVTGRQAPPLPPLAGARPVRPREAGSIEFAYEVQYLLDAPDDTIGALRARLAAIGDSVAVIGADGSYNVHVHTNDVGHAIELGTDAGRPHSISVVEFEEQISETRGLPVSVASSPVALVAIARGDGWRALYQELGASVVSDASGLADAIEQAPANDVIVLANGEEGAEAAAHSPTRAVEVLATANPAEGFAAMLAFAPSRSMLDNLEEIRGALARTRTAGVDEDAGIVDAALALGEGEILTVFAAEDVSDDARARALALLRGALHPAVEIELRQGGQPSPRYLLVLE